MSVIVEGKKSVLLAGTASLIDDSREMAWAEKHVVKQPDIRWVLGNYVAADSYNSNGHLFLMDDLKDSITSIPNKPLNLIHLPHRIVGNFAAAEFVYPTEETAGSGIDTPVVEALAAFYSYYFPELFPAIEMAHKEGQLFFSMEAVPSQLTCKGKGSFEGCGAQFDYDGRTSDTYCSHLNEVASRKVLHRAHFTAGALIIPPTRPGWKHADIKELSHLIENNLAEAEAVYDQVAAMSSHLEPRSWERIMAFLLSAANTKESHV